MTKLNKLQNQARVVISSLRKSIKNEKLTLKYCTNDDSLSVGKHYNIIYTDSENELHNLLILKTIIKIDEISFKIKKMNNDVFQLKNEILSKLAIENEISIQNEFNEKIEEFINKQPKRYLKFRKILDMKIINTFSIKTKVKYDYRLLLESKINDWVKYSNEIIKINEIERDLKISDFQDSFPLARALKREFIIHIGPTNSGKTYAAINEMISSNSGVYLAPLRLMANECYDDLLAKQIPCSLITGEERKIDQFASFTSSTVEMCEFNKRLDVAVIDEIQMISDEFRGWAWSQALIGVSANKVILVGSEDALPYIIPVINNLGEKYKIIKHQRKTPLEVKNPIYKYGDLKKGDAFVVFSRKQALEHKYVLESLGHSCSIIYGNLSPEVRKNEALKFRNNLTDILIATDAIGMGLNLPIKRVILSSIQKYDGIDIRDLTVSEIKQIGGRAGRYGINKNGEVVIWSDSKKSTKNLLERAIYGGYESVKDSRIYISPNLQQIKIICEATGINDLKNSLVFFQQKLLKRDDIYRVANIDPMIEICDAISHIDFDLNTRFGYCCAPIDIKNIYIGQFLRQWANNHSKKIINTIPPFPTYMNESRLEDTLLIYENHVKLLMLYRWLHFRYESIYPFIDKAIEETDKANDIIEKLLSERIKEKNKAKDKK